MALLLARCAVPAWFIMLGLGVFLAPAGIITTGLVVTMGFVCALDLLNGCRLAPVADRHR